MNWADIISGKKSFREDGAAYVTVKKEIESESDAEEEAEDDGVEITFEAGEDNSENNRKSNNGAGQGNEVSEGTAVNDDVDDAGGDDEGGDSAVDDAAGGDDGAVDGDGEMIINDDSVDEQHEGEGEAGEEKGADKGAVVTIMMNDKGTDAQEDLESEGSQVEDGKTGTAKKKNIKRKLVRIGVDEGNSPAKKKIKDDDYRDVKNYNYKKKDESPQAKKPLILFKCTVCPKKFVTQTYLEQHVQFMHPNADLKTEQQDGDEDDDFADELGISAKAEKPVPVAMMNYVGNYVQRKKKPRFGCEKCGMDFSALICLKKHMELHSNKVYECPYCAKIMKRTDYVIGHIKKVHPEVDLKKNPIDFDKYTHVVSEEDLTGKPSSDVKKDKVEKFSGIGKKVCPDCSSLFDTVEELEEHLKEVHKKELKDAVYTCNACDKQFKTVASYQVHKLTHRKKDYTCAHCDMKFNTNAQLQHHKRKDHEIKHGSLAYFGYLTNNGRLTCEVCSSEFEDIDSYIKHRPDHLTFMFMCSTCGTGFHDEDMYQRHLESYCQDEEFLPFPCGVCDKKFSMYDTRRKHLHADHPKVNKQPYCHHCAQVFGTEEELALHMPEHEIERVFICEICQRTFYEKRTLVDHRDIHRASKNFQCKICLKFYPSTKSLQRHIKMHLAKKNKSCRLCNEEFSTPEDLNRHVEEAHGAVLTETEFSCPECPARFKTESKLEQHRIMHSVEDAESNYLCVHCNMVFDSTKMPLAVHLQESHPDALEKPEVPYGSGENQYKCPYCNYTSHVKQRMERHKETHSMERKFECQYCWKKFRTTSTFMTHLIMHRGKVRKNAKPSPDCTWPNCNKSFIKHSIYKRHIIAHIYKIKTLKEVCTCNMCFYSVVGGKNIAMKIMTSDETLENIEGVGILDGDGKSKIIAPMPIIQSLEKTIEIKGNGSQEYQSMEVLHEAIAKVEEIERGHDNETVEQTDGEGEEHVDNRESDEDGTTSGDGSQAGQIGVDDAGTSIQQESIKDKHLIPSVVMDDTESADGESQDRDTNKQYVVVHPVSSEPDNNMVIDAMQVSGTDSIVADHSSLVISQPDGQLPGTLDADGDPMAVVHGRYECGVCELMFEFACHVLNHFEKVHPTFAFPQCEVCLKYAMDAKSLADHVATHDEVKRFECEKCGRKFRTKAILRQHSYIHEQDKPYNCEFCGHGFTQRGFFDEHRRRHLGMKPFKCTVCSKQFVTKNLLKIHMYSHATQRPHKCPYCSKGFTERYQMQVHMRQHEDNRPFQCGSCLKTFCARNKLIRHMNTIHGIDKGQLSCFVATKVGEGMGYRDATKTPSLRPIRPNNETGAPGTSTRTIQVVYIDQQGKIVKEAQDEAIMEQVGHSSASKVFCCCFFAFIFPNILFI